MNWFKDIGSDSFINKNWDKIQAMADGGEDLNKLIEKEGSLDEVSKLAVKAFNKGIGEGIREKILTNIKAKHEESKSDNIVKTSDFFRNKFAFSKQKTTEDHIQTLTDIHENKLFGVFVQELENEMKQKIKGANLADLAGRKALLADLKAIKAKFMETNKMGSDKFFEFLEAINNEIRALEKMDNPFYKYEKYKK